MAVLTMLFSKGKNTKWRVEILHMKMSLTVEKKPSIAVCKKSSNCVLWRIWKDWLALTMSLETIDSKTASSKLNTSSTLPGIWLSISSHLLQQRFRSSCMQSAARTCWTWTTWRAGGTLRPTNGPNTPLLNPFWSNIIRNGAEDKNIFSMYDFRSFYSLSIHPKNKKKQNILQKTTTTCWWQVNPWYRIYKNVNLWETDYLSHLSCFCRYVLIYFLPLMCLIPW